MATITTKINSITYILLNEIKESDFLTIQYDGATDFLNQCQMVIIDILL